MEQVDSMTGEAGSIPSPPSSPRGSHVHQRRVMARSGTKSSDGGEDFFPENDVYDSLEKDGVSQLHTHYPSAQKSTLQVGTVALLVFFTVSGGPLGSEDAVSLMVFAHKELYSNSIRKVGAVGPQWALLMYLLFPWIYALPVALVTGELSSMFPEDASFTLWVNEAFGPFWAYQEGYWSILSGMTNNAMYMLMVIEIVQRSSVGLMSPGIRWTLGAIFALLCTVPNFLGIRMMGRVLLVLIVVVLLPYVIMICLALPYADTKTWTSGPPERSSIVEDRSFSMNQRDSEHLHGWSLMLSTAFWNFGGFDCASTYAGEVHEPSKTYPKALLASLALITTSLVLPLFAVTISSGNFPESPPYREWSDGTYVDLAWRIGGEPLQLMVALSGMASQIAMFTTEMFVCSHLILGMSQQRLAPKFLRGRDASTGAPIIAVGFMLGVVLTGFTVLDRYSLLVMNNTFAGAAVLLELASAVAMRAKHAARHPQKQVPFRAPCRTQMSLAISLMPAVIISAVVVTPALIMSDVNCAVTTSFLVAFGWLSFRIWPE